MERVVEVQDLSKSFGALKAVDRINFSIPRGSICGFLGPNGSGKSTTLRMMMDLIRPDAGKISWFGQALSEHRAKTMQRIGCIIEKPDFYTYLSAEENLRLLARASGVGFSQKKLDAILELVVLKGREKDKIKTFSHGMKQRLGLAQALIHQPEVVILDEPNTGLDPQGILDLREVILKLNREQGITFLFSSHILAEVQEVCSDLLVIHNGKMVVQGKKEDLLSQQALWVDVEMDDRAASIQFAEQEFFKQGTLRQEKNLLQVKMARQDIPALVAHLQGQGLSVYKVEYRNQLEQYFLEITSTAS